MSKDPYRHRILVILGPVILGEEMPRADVGGLGIPQPLGSSARLEKIVSGRSRNLVELAAGVRLRALASEASGVEGMSTWIGVFSPAMGLPYHRHDVSEAITVLSGEARVEVEGRTYQLRPLDCLHVPAGVAHSTVNSSGKKKLMLHNSFGAVRPERYLAKDSFVSAEKIGGMPDEQDPEHLVRIAQAKTYGLAGGTSFCDLFAGQFGAVGICGGYGEFQPGTSLPRHIHDYDESITIVKGTATCEVMGRRYQLSGYDTAMVPSGRPHRFLNESRKMMAMIWVYAGSEPHRNILNARFCNGKWKWKRQG
jgi:quercetin dioxygenase-like cupin family protein